MDAGEQSIVVEYPNLSKDEIVDKKDFLLAQTFSLKEKLYQKNYYSFLAQVLSLERKCYFRPSTWMHHLLTIKGYDDFKRKVKGARSFVGYWWGKRTKL